MNMLKVMTVCFWCGCMAMAGLHMFIQDWLGLERYIVFAREHWVHMSYMWGAIMFAAAIVLYFHKRTQITRALAYEESDSDG